MLPCRWMAIRRATYYSAFIELLRSPPKARLLGGMPVKISPVFGIFFLLWRSCPFNRPPPQAQCMTSSMRMAMNSPF
jgi:hypothetical protein